MPIELKVPEIGESITEVEIGAWLKRPGDIVRKDEPIVTLESEKATVELASPDSGTMAQILKEKGAVAKVGEVIAYVQSGGPAMGTPKAAESKASPEKAAPKPEIKPEEAPVPPRVMPAAQMALEQHGLSAEAVRGTGPGGRILKEDVLRELQEDRPETPATPSHEPSPAPPSTPPAATLRGIRAGGIRSA